MTSFQAVASGALIISVGLRAFTDKCFSTEMAVKCYLEI